MQFHDRHRNKGLLLQSTILAVFFCFVLQGVFTAYVHASALPDTDVYTSVLKDRGAKSAPEIKKPVKLVAVPGCTITLDPRTNSSSISRLYSTFTAARYQSTAPARAPPAPLF